MPRKKGVLVKMKNMHYRKFISYPMIVPEKSMVRLINEKYVIKIADCNLQHLFNLQQKHIDKVETPKSIYKIIKDKKNQYAYTTTYWETYSPLSKYPLTCSTEEYINLILSIMQTIREMHQQDLYSQDLRNTNNIIINRDLDYRLIDFDYSIVNKKASLKTPGELYASYRYIYENYPKKLGFLEQARITNKLVLLDLLIKGLTEGQVDDDTPTIIEEDVFPKEFEEEIFAIFTGKREIKEEDYLEDLIKTLLDNNYQSKAIEQHQIKTRKIS